ncbi:MAG: hypothetical protein EXS63_09540 [Candidatus Omnitrophica bacterium]|nr:hypothetical protein [Candidatus Omnitrophota bacterium]
MSFYAYLLYSFFVYLEAVLDKCFRWLDRPVKRIFQKDQRYYYGPFNADESAAHNLYKNLRKPQKFFKKIAYGQFVPLPQLIKLSRPTPKDFKISAEARDILDRFKQDGIVILPGYFPEYAKHIMAKYQIDPCKVDFSSQGQGKKIALNSYDAETIKVLADPLIIQIFSGVYGCQPFVREVPVIAMVRPYETQPRTRQMPQNERPGTVGWHYDTANMLSVGILLNDISKEDTRMQIAKKARRKHRVKLTDRFYSDEIIEEHFEIVDCYGPAGTVYLFDPNAPHRRYEVKDSCRVSIYTSYTPGNDIKTLVFPDEKEQRLDISAKDLAHFSDLQKNVFKYITIGNNEFKSQTPSEKQFSAASV